MIEATPVISPPADGTTAHVLASALGLQGDKPTTTKAGRPITLMPKVATIGQVVAIINESPGISGYQLGQRHLPINAQFIAFLPPFRFDRLI
jgi:hypothetical protein